jgi:hypothetical protein
LIADERANPTYFARQTFRLPPTATLPSTPPDRVVIANSNNYVLPQYQPGTPESLLSQFQAAPTMALVLG